MAKFCPNCGNEIDPDASFCNYCGSQLTKGELKDTPPAQPVSQPSSPSQYNPYHQAQSGQQPQYQQQAQTGMGVRYADFGERFVAFLIDAIIIGIIGWGISAAIGGYFWSNFLLDWGIGFVYLWGLETVNQGQTLGKALLKVRTVDEITLQPADAGKYAINNLLKPSFLILLDLVLGLVSNSNDQKNRYRYMQKASGTVVIKGK